MKSIKLTDKISVLNLLAVLLIGVSAQIFTEIRYRRQSQLSRELQAVNQYKDNAPDFYLAAKHIVDELVAQTQGFRFYSKPVIDHFRDQAAQLRQRHLAYRVKMAGLEKQLDSMGVTYEKVRIEPPRLIHQLDNEVRLHRNRYMSKLGLRESTERLTEMLGILKAIDSNRYLLVMPTEDVNLRARPNSLSAVQAVALQGDSLLLLGFNARRQWYNVRTRDHLTGWVDAQLVYAVLEGL